MSLFGNLNKINEKNKMSKCKVKDITFAEEYNRLLRLLDNEYKVLIRCAKDLNSESDSIVLEKFFKIHNDIVNLKKIWIKADGRI